MLFKSGQYWNFSQRLRNSAASCSSIALSCFLTQSCFFKQCILQILKALVVFEGFVLNCFPLLDYFGIAAMCPKMLQFSSFKPGLAVLAYSSFITCCVCVIFKRFTFGTYPNFQQVTNYSVIHLVGKTAIIWTSFFSTNYFFLPYCLHRILSIRLSCIFLMAHFCKNVFMSVHKCSKHSDSEVVRLQFK